MKPYYWWLVKLACDNEKVASMFFSNNITPRAIIVNHRIQNDEAVPLAVLQQLLEYE